ncbi:hypothetical protein pdul_cds_328 [Pandoravirus dulcis]|uniref:Uncharacterized protein n=1 Tax=Pandoravirus dulcis TaxID=1349409 RepID=S4VPY5_9VIRU|nr:hypothetical protein pdul_cds_328 [Pandoravirus dulcis]AGO82337.2 hypothetical protein pdul_cds_328 [Pandoravirus dulcis]
MATPSSACKSTAPLPLLPMDDEAVSAVIGEAVALVAQAYADCKTHYIALGVMWRSSMYRDDPIASIAFNGECLYAGEPIAPEDAGANVIARIAQADDKLYRRTIYINGRLPPWDRYVRLPHENHGGEWLVRALRGDDVAHCALMIAAMVGCSEWKALASTATNLRTGRACPRLARLAALVADARASGDPFDVACDAVFIGDTLNALGAEAAADDGSARREISLIPWDGAGIGAVSAGPGAWRLAKVNGAGTIETIDDDVMTARDAARAMAVARARPSDALTMTISIDGCRIGVLPLVGGFLCDAIEGAALDSREDHRRALDDALPLIGYGSMKRCLTTVAESADAATAFGTPTPLADNRAAASLAHLEEDLKRADLDRLRRHLGAHWERATPQHAVATMGHTFNVDARGTWRDDRGRAVSWDDFTRLMYARDRSAAAESVLVTATSMHRGTNVRAHMAHRDPCHAPDLAHGLCRHALAGDTRATACLMVLSIMSPQWTMLARTVANVVRWVDQGCPPSPADRWADPLVDWILDVRPHEDAREHFDGAQKAFSAAAIADLVGKGHPVPPCTVVDAASGRALAAVCNCAPRPDNDANAPAEWCCVWKLERRLLIEKGAASPYYVDTYRSAVVARLTCTPLATDGRQILAAEAFCPLLGERGRGVEALVRALYTVDSLRTKIMDPAQLALAERALS